MNILNTIKFKKAESPNYYYKIDLSTGNRISFSSNSKPKTSGFGMNLEMIAYVAGGNKIEDQYTTKEQVIKDQKEAEQEAIAWIGKRKAEYPTIEELTVALWEKGVEGRPESADILEIKRQIVKEKYPKPI